jgi:hypothetical protein
MAKLNWNRARSTRQTWAYTASPHITNTARCRTRQDWIYAKLIRDISDISHKVALGKSWIATIPTSDPRYPRWARRLYQLLSQRKALRAKINAAHTKARLSHNRYR